MELMGGWWGWRSVGGLDEGGEMGDGIEEGVGGMGGVDEEGVVEVHGGGGMNC